MNVSKKPGVIFKIALSIPVWCCFVSNCCFSSLCDSIFLDACFCVFTLVLLNLYLGSLKSIIESLAYSTFFKEGGSHEQGVGVKAFSEFLLQDSDVKSR